MNTREHYDSLLERLEPLPSVEIRELLYDFYMEGHYGGEQTQAEIDEDKRVKLRDQFATAALKETAGELKDTHPPVEIAEWCYVMADAMLEARKR